MIEGRCTNLGGVLKEGNTLMLHSVMMRVLSDEQRRDIINAYNRQKARSIKGQDGGQA